MARPPSVAAALALFPNGGQRLARRNAHEAMNACRLRSQTRLQATRAFQEMGGWRGPDRSGMAPSFGNRGSDRS